MKQLLRLLTALMLFFGLTHIVAVSIARKNKLSSVQGLFLSFDLRFVNTLETLQNDTHH